MPMIIDDFSSGIYDVTLKNGGDFNYQTGKSMVGGYRYTALIVGMNPQDQPVKHILFIFDTFADFAIDSIEII